MTIEEKAKEYCPDDAYPFAPAILNNLIREAFIAGYNLCKEQMLKEAEEYEVGMHGEPIKITFDKYVQRAKGIFPGDKVRVIICKKEDEK